MALIHHVIPIDFDQTGLKQHEISSELFSPLQLDRLTISPSKYEKYREYLKRDPLSSWQHGKAHSYDVTNLKKSDVRMNDQLLPAPPSDQMNEKFIKLPTPAEHPCASHTSRFAVFPNFTSPDDPLIGDPARCPPPLKLGKAAGAHNVLVDMKTKGFPYRLERQSIIPADQRKALEWCGENGFFHQKPEQQKYFPTPHKLIHPNLRLRNNEQTISLKTANCLRNVEKEQQMTTYNYNFTGKGTSNVMKLDDYHDKLKESATNKSDFSNYVLRPTSSPMYLPPRPMEGRNARILQNRRPLTADIRYPDEPTDELATKPDVSDTKIYESYPKKLLEPDQENDDVRGNNEWKKIQFENTSAYELNQLIKKRGNNEAKWELARTHETFEPAKSYLQISQEARNQKFKQLEATDRRRQLELMYDSKRHLLQLRHKVDQFGARDAPRAFNYHQQIIMRDQNEMNDAKLEIENVGNDLKFSTEKITDRGQLDPVYNRQLQGHRDYARNFDEDNNNNVITEQPRQNHGSLTSRDYVIKSNPYSLSSRPDHPECDVGSSKNGILKSDWLSPLARSKRNITFNELVEVASSEIGTEIIKQTEQLSQQDQQIIKPLSKLSQGMTINTTRPALRPDSPEESKQRGKCGCEYYDIDFRLDNRGARSASGLEEMRKSWSKSEAYRKFHKNFPENAPDLRCNINRKEMTDTEGSDDKISKHSVPHREKRHNFHGFNSYYLHNGNPTII